MNKDRRPLALKLGQMMRETRNKLGMRQLLCAEQIGCSNSVLCGWEKGYTSPDKRYWERIKEVLGIDFNEYSKELEFEAECIRAEEPSEFSKKLREIRTKRGMSINAFTVAVLGHSGDTARKWERGEMFPNEESMNMIRDKLGMDENMEGLKPLWEAEIAQRADSYARGKKIPRRAVSKRTFRKKKLVNVSFNRILREIWNNGYELGIPKNPRAFLGEAARIVVSYTFNRRNNLDPLEIPYEIPADPESGDRRWLYFFNHQLWVTNSIFDYAWDVYLRNHGLAASVVMDEADEDAEFFSDEK